MNGMLRLLRRAFALVASVILAACGSAAGGADTVVPPPLSQRGMVRGDAALIVTLLGTGDPTPRIDRFGPSTLVEAGDKALLFDIGRGAMQRLYQIGHSSAKLDAIFLTHLHSDHVVGLVDLWLTGWVIDRRKSPLRIYGPPGTAEMVEHLGAAFTFDIDIRTSEARLDPQGVRLEVVEMEDGFVWSEGDVTVRAFLVDHSPVEPAFGFRVDRDTHAVALSGDTRYSEALIRHARGVDLLLHEVAEASEERKAERPLLPRLAHHTQAADAGRVFTAVRPKLAVFTHLVLVDGFDPAGLIPLARSTWDGPLVVGEDLMTFRIGAEVAIEKR